jgi:hypothetical protein
MTNFKKTFTDKTAYNELVSVFPPSETIQQPINTQEKIEEIKEIIDTNELSNDVSSNLDEPNNKEEILKAFDYSIPKKKKLYFSVLKKQYILPLVSLIVITTVGIAAIYSIQAPAIAADSLKPSNQDGILKSKKPFYTILNGVNTHSQEVNGDYIVNIGKVEGDNKVKIGGLAKIGPVTIESLSTQQYNILRDYTPISINTPINKYYESKDAVINIDIPTTETDYSLFLNNTLYFESNNPNSNCSIINKSLNCNVSFGTDNSKPIKLELVDKVGNKSTIFENNIELVKTSTVKCDKKQIETEGKLKCVPDYDGEVSIKGVNIQVKNGVEFEYPEVLNDGQQKLEFKIVTSKGIKKEISEDYTVNKQLLDIKFSTVIDDKNGSQTKPLIILQAVSSTDSQLSYIGSYSENSSKQRKSITYGINTQYKSNEKEIVSSEVYDEEKKENLTYRLKFSNQAGRTLTYSCIRNFNDKEFKCAKN